MNKKTIVFSSFFSLLFLLAGCQPQNPSSLQCNPSSQTATQLEPPANITITGVTVSGQIHAASSTYSDSDINDIYANNYHISNDTFGAAQAVANPAVIGGYVNAPGSGYTGSSYSSGDTADCYSVSLKAGDNISLYIADAGQDLDLYLYNTSQTVVDSSVSINQVETVTASSAGNYYLAVTAYGYARSNYTVAVGGAQITDIQNYLSEDDFAPGEILVRFKEQFVPADVGLAGVQTAPVGLQVKSGAPGRVMLLSLGEEIQQQQAARMLGFSRVDALGKYMDPTVRLKVDTMKAVEALRKRADVLTADLNYRRTIMEVPTDSNYSSQWHYPLINLPLAWEDTDDIHGDGAIVAVIDTGVLVNHPDLNGQISADGGYDFISSTSISNDGDGIDSNPDDPGDKIPPETRSSFHGTHVAGTIAAETCLPGVCANGSAGVAGIAPRAKIMPLRVLGQGGGYDSDIIQAMYYAADLANDSGTKPTLRGGAKADVINMSLGGGSFSQTFQDAVTAVNGAGVIIIAAAGNSATSTPSYPAAYDGVVAVSSVNRNKALAYYSNYGNWVDVAAPGGETSGGSANGILSTLGDDSSGSISYTYGFYQGTSMAAPHVAGIAALMKAYANFKSLTLTPAVFDSKLASGDLTDDIGTAGKDNSFGYGLINASKSLVSSGLVLDIPPVIVVSPSSADLGGSTTSKTITVSNGSSGPSEGPLNGVTVSTDGSSWLGVSSGSLGDIAVGGSTQFNITVNRSGLEDGYYSGSVTISSSSPTADDLIIQVSMYKGSIAGNAGYQYITLVDANTQNQFAQLPTNRDPITGTYSFSFTGVPDGDYFIVSGTDMDNDFFFCDGGEACGTYPDVGTFTVSGGNINGIQFETGYYVPSGAAASSTKNAVRREALPKSSAKKKSAK